MAGSSRNLSARGRKSKRNPKTALDGIGWSRVEERGEIKLRCHRCEKVVPVMLWWKHGAGMEDDCCPRGA